MNPDIANVDERDALSEQNRPTILVVDDEEDIRTVLRLTLTRAGFEVREAGSGEAALLYVAETKPDLILLDVLMPGMDGFAVCRALRQKKETADMPILLFSARTDSRSRQEGLEAGATKYLTKPLRPEQLLYHIGDALRGRSG